MKLIQDGQKTIDECEQQIIAWQTNYEPTEANTRIRALAHFALDVLAEKFGLTVHGEKVTLDKDSYQDTLEYITDPF